MPLLLAIVLAAQTVAGPVLSGVVRDPSGKVVPGAVVIVRSSTGAEQQTVTGPDGRFSLPAAPAGPTTVIVRMPSFGEARRTVPADAPPTDLDILLQPAILSETVTVTA